MTEIARSLLKKETVFLDCDDQRDLVRSQWPIGLKLWLSYRILMTVYWVTTFLRAFINKFFRYQWIFFTMISHWAFLVFVLSIILKMACVIKYLKWLQRPRADYPDEEKPILNKQPSWFLIHNFQRKGKFLLQLSWLIANIANVFAIQVTVDYWKGAGPPANIVSAELNIQIHGVNAAVVILETLLVAQPTFLLHFYQPLLFHFSYLAFTAFYYAAGGLSKNGTRAIYYHTDWAHPIRIATLYLGFGSLQVVAIHVGLWAIAFIRTLIWNICQKSKLEEKEEL